MQEHVSAAVFGKKTKLEAMPQDAAAHFIAAILEPPAKTMPSK